MPTLIHQQIEGGVNLRLVEPRSSETRGTMVYLHGLGESGLCFEKVMCDGRLEQWRHLAIDLPGYGKSPWPLEPVGFDLVVDFLADWLGAHLNDRFVLLGHSMGGTIGARVASTLPRRVRAFVSVEGNISLDDCTGSLQISDYSLESFCRRGFAEVAASMYVLGLDSAPFQGYYASLRMCDPRVLHHDAVALVELSRAERLATELGDLDIPTLYVLGDPGGAGEHSRELLDAAGVTWRPIADAGHWPYLDQHDLFVDELGRFLGDLDE